MKFKPIQYRNQCQSAMQSFRLKLFAFRQLPAMVGLALCFLLILPAQSAELYLFEDEYCPWCEKWDEEIGVIYDMTEESCQASLRRFGLRDEIPENVQLNNPVSITPTFVLVHKSREAGRIEGYSGEDFFWLHLNNMLVSGLPEEFRESRLKDCNNS